jgi:hypothetical protein
MAGSRGVALAGRGENAAARMLPTRRVYHWRGGGDRLMLCAGLPHSRERPLDDLICVTT